MPTAYDRLPASILGKNLLNSKQKNRLYSSGCLKIHPSTILFEERSWFSTEGIPYSGQMEKYDYITESQKDSLQALKMDINFNPESHREGLATYFRMYLQGYLNDWIKKNPKPALEGERDRWNIYLDGLKVYTTIDSKMQKNAEDAVTEHMERLQAEFFHQNTPQRNPTTPFLDLEKEEINRIMERAMKNSERWRVYERARQVRKRNSGFV